MNKMVDEQIRELLTNSQSHAMLECERALRVGAATLCQVRSGEITATTVVCHVGDDDLDAVESLVVDIADEFGVDARVQQQAGFCAVRFSCQAPSEPVPPSASERSWLRRLLTW